MADDYNPNLVEDATQKETDVKCPSCGAAVEFDPATGHMHCEYCGYTRDIPMEENAKAVEEKDFLAAENTGGFEWGAEKKLVICKSCGAESVYDALQVSDVCPYCGSTLVTSEQVKDSIAPTGVAPFRVTKEQAGVNFGKWLKAGLFTPSKAKKSCKADSFNGIYLPYWTYDSRTTSRYTGEAGFEYKVTDKEGHTETKVRWRRVSGVHTEFFDDELVLASNRHDANILNRVLPFDYTQLVPYSPEYVAGFVSERYSVGLKDGWGIARGEIDRKIRDSIAKEIRQRYNADRSQVGQVSSIFENITYKYVLFPIWMSSFKYKDKVFQFVVNGQTGKVGGKMPVSPLRVAVFIGILLAVIAGIVLLFENCEG